MKSDRDLNLPDVPAPSPQKLSPPRASPTASPHRVHAGLLAGLVIFAALFVFLLLSAYHKPTPHELPVGVVGPPAAARQFQAALGAPGAFDLRSYPDLAQARSGVVNGSLDGAVMAVPGGLRLLTVGAAGIGPVQALTGAFGAVAAHQSQRLSVVDVVPPLNGDSEAFSAFFVTLGVLFPSLVAGVASSLLLRHSSPRWHVAWLVAVAVLTGLAAAGLVDGMAGFGKYPALAGILALFSLAVAAPAAALARLKPAASGAAFLVFVTISIPVAGGPGNLAHFTPGYLRVLEPGLPLGIAASAMRTAVYFHGHDIGGYLWVLAAWAVVGAVATLLIFRRHPEPVTAPQ